jgi:hypothetical protein
VVGGGGGGVRALSAKQSRTGAEKISLLELLECAGSGIEIIPGKNSYTRIKPLPLTNGHGRYTTVTPERTLAFVGEWPLFYIYITVINL